LICKKAGRKRLSIIVSQPEGNNMKLATALFALAISSLTLPAFAADAGSAAINTIGQINGVALACQQPAIVSRARNTIQTTAPKTRANGELFETATNAAYLEQGKGAACPDAASLSNRLNAAEKDLQAAFPAAQ
jgi:hypothetical protein